LLGVLCLCFDFQDECQRIFAELEDTDWTVMALTDEQGVVIASHDSVQVPVGSVMRGAHKCAVSVQRFAGRQYLSFTCKGKGYQGYLGQGWMGHAMVPLEYAFEQMKALTLELPSIDRLTVFSQDLIMIPQQADQIQERLNRSVWNGSVRQARNPTDSGFGRALLNEVSQTGLKTKAVFAGAIANLYQTVIGATLENNRILASLAVNIMDRNLYERANDCRWWALTDVFRQLLSKEALTTEDKKQMSQVLAYINQLYTVYTGLIIYDKDGCVQAVSQKHLLPFIGKNLQASWIDASLKLTDSQAYVVSDFETTPLYDNKATYIYAAAIMHPDHEAQAVGGIGIIFDATPQFATILEDASPEGHGQESFAICYDEHQRIISTTHPTLQVGDILPADMTLAQNQGSAVLSCGYGRYAVGVAQSTGYREYKGEGDAYQQVIYAAMFKRIGMLSTDDYMTKEASITAFNFSAAGPKKAIATFAIGEQCFGLSASDVIESIDVDLMARVAVANSIFSGYVKYDNYPVPVLDLSSYLEESLTAQQQVVIIESNEVRFALLVSKIGSVVSVPTAMIMPVSSYSQTNLIESLVTEQSKSLPILMLLSSNKIRELVISGRVVMEVMPDISELIEASSNKEEHTL
jgi:chemotaxis signal transduction protein